MILSHLSLPIKKLKVEGKLNLLGTVVIVSPVDEGIDCIGTLVAVATVDGKTIVAAVDEALVAAAVSEALVTAAVDGKTVVNDCIGTAALLVAVVD